MSKTFHRSRQQPTKQFKGRTRLDLPLSSKFKTEMCHYLKEQGRCPYGDICTYAHNTNEIRFIERHPKHKTLPCRDFSEGFCPFGERCSFIHNKSDSKNFLPQNLSNWKHNNGGESTQSGYQSGGQKYPEQRQLFFQQQNTNFGLPSIQLEAVQTSGQEQEIMELSGGELLKPPSGRCSADSSRSPSSLSSISSRWSSYSDLSDWGNSPQSPCFDRPSSADEESVCPASVNSSSRLPVFLELTLKDQFVPFFDE